MRLGFLLSVSVLHLAALVILFAYGPRDSSVVRLGPTYLTKNVELPSRGTDGVACRFREEYDEYLAAITYHDMPRVFWLFDADSTP